MFLVSSSCLLHQSSADGHSIDSAKWPGFHTSAEQSKGVGKTNDQHITEPKKAHEPHPEEVTRCIEACKDDWRYLQKFARTS